MIQPPSPSDIRIAVEAWWPRVVLEGGLVIEGERAWLDAIERANPYERLALWEALRASDVP
jgi:hypothetical protein